MLKDLEEDIETVMTYLKDVRGTLQYLDYKRLPDEIKLSLSELESQCSVFIEELNAAEFRSKQR